MTKCFSCGDNFGKYNHQRQSGQCPSCVRSRKFLDGLMKVLDSFKHDLYETLYIFFKKEI